MGLRLSRLRFAAVGFTALAVLGAPTAASADSADGPGDATHTEVVMTRVPIASRGEAQPDGTTQVVLGTGVTITVSTAALATMDAALAKPKPHGAVWGDCGMSYIDLYEKSNREPARILTGFKVFDNAVEYQWHGYMRGQQNFSDHQDWGGGLNFRKTWVGEYSTFFNERHGHWQAWVYQPSFAITTDGICVSGDPVAVKDL
jgi:hypothetical protein